MARLYADENFPVPVVEELRSLRHDVLTSHEAGRSGQGVSDEQVLDDAILEQRAVLTLNRKHFSPRPRRIPEVERLRGSGASFHLRIRGSTHLQALGNRTSADRDRRRAGTAP
ncbi:MAG: DUF5615 family PIN-like protein [Isosphaeraceae bacterium]